MSRLISITVIDCDGEVYLSLLRNASDAHYPSTPVLILPSSPLLRASYASSLLNLLLLFHNTSLDYLDIFLRPILTPSLDQPQPLDGVHTTLDPPENSVFTIEPGRGCQRYEELGAVGIWTRVGHAENTGAGVLERRVNLVGELFAVDGSAAAAGAGRVSALNHEVGDDAVEDGAVVVAAADEGGEVVAGLGGVRCVEFEGEGALE